MQRCCQGGNLRAAGATRAQIPRDTELDQMCLMLTQRQGCYAAALWRRQLSDRSFRSSLSAPWIRLLRHQGGDCFLPVDFIRPISAGRPPCRRGHYVNLLRGVSCAWQVHRQDRHHVQRSGSLPVSSVADSRAAPARSGEPPSAPDRRSSSSSLQD